MSVTKKDEEMFKEGVNDLLKLQKKGERKAKKVRRKRGLKRGAWKGK